MDFVGAHVQLDLIRCGLQIEFPRGLMQTVTHAVVVTDCRAGKVEHRQFDFVSGHNLEQNGLVFWLPFSVCRSE